MYQNNIKNLICINVELKAGNYCYFNIAEQWNAILDCRKLAESNKALFLKLLELTDRLENKDDTMQLFTSPEWGDLVALRGPVDAAWEAECNQCGAKNIGFGFSGFGDINYEIDYQNKTIRFFSSYEKRNFKDLSICFNCKEPLYQKKWGSPYRINRGFKIVRED